MKINLRGCIGDLIGAGILISFHLVGFVNTDFKICWGFKVDFWWKEEFWVFSLKSFVLNTAASPCNILQLEEGGAEPNTFHIYIHCKNWPFSGFLAKLWNLIKFIKSSWNSKFRLKLWNLVRNFEIVKFDQNHEKSRE